MKYKKWTTEEDEFIAVANEAGWKAKDIAVELDRSLDSVLQRRNRLGIVGISGVADKYTKEELIRFLKEAPIKTYEYFNSASSGTPAATTYRKYFGSWEAALAAAGVDSNNCTMKEDLPTTLYLVEFKEGFFKIGITQRDIKIRLDNRYPDYSIVLSITMDLAEARKVEREWLDSVLQYKFIPTNFPKEARGSGECFKI